MMLVQLWLTLCLYVMAVLHMSVSITVTFPSKVPLYVAPGRTLVLEAQFQVQQNEKLLLLAWERKNDKGLEVRVADLDNTINNRTSMGNNGASLKITGVTESDYGTYTVTVTAANGKQVSDSRKVLNITNPPVASLSMHCSVPTKEAQWDSPSFSWQVDGVTITNETGELSTDGRTLRLIELGRNYTCVTDSSQGTSKVNVSMKELSAQTTPEPGTDPTSCSCAGWRVAAGISIIVNVILVAVLIRMCWKNLSCTRRQREQSGTL